MRGVSGGSGGSGGSGEGERSGRRGKGEQRRHLDLPKLVVLLVDVFLVFSHSLEERLVCGRRSRVWQRAGSEGRPVPS